MMSSFNEAIKIILMHEGGYIEHESDKGGATNWGISLRFAQSFNPTLTKEDIKGMSRDHAIQIYLEGFWNPNRYEEIQCDIIATKVMDFCVNAGANTANKVLQNACNNLNADKEAAIELVVDGINGSQTIQVVNCISCVALITQLRIYMREFYQEFVKNDKSQAVFLNGLLKRADW